MLLQNLQIFMFFLFLKDKQQNLIASFKFYKITHLRICVKMANIIGPYKTLKKKKMQIMQIFYVHAYTKPE